MRVNNVFLQLIILNYQLAHSATASAFKNFKNLNTQYLKTLSHLPSLKTDIS